MATIVEVARRAEVSTTTVSHVVNGTRFVSRAAGARVRAAIEALGYCPNGLARSLRRGQSDTLGLVLPDSGNPFFAEIGRAIELAAFEAGFSVFLCNTANDRDRERLYLDVLARQQVDGIVLVASDERSNLVSSLLRGRVPLLAVDREHAGLALDTVVADHQLGGQLATRHLIDLGHRRIGCVSGPSRLSPSVQRLTGHRRALREAGLASDETLVIAGDFSPGSGASAARALLKRRGAPTAIFACNDLMALGVLSAAATLGRRVPGDLAVVGYDDIELAAFATPPLTTVVQPKLEMGRAIVRMLVNRMRDTHLPPQRVVLPVALRVRQSCGAGAEAPRRPGGGGAEIVAASSTR